MRVKRFNLIMIFVIIIAISSCSSSTKETPEASTETKTESNTSQTDELEDQNKDNQDETAQREIEEPDVVEQVVEDAPPPTVSEITEEETIPEVEKEIPPPLVEAVIDEPPPVPELEIVYFDYDKSDIKSQFEESLQENYEWIKAHPDAKIQLDGHADERGTNEYNLALGERRGHSVLQYLINLGANPEQFTVVSFGEERPAAFGSNEESWQKNRRVEFFPL